MQLKKKYKLYKSMIPKRPALKNTKNKKRMKKKKLMKINKNLILKNKSIILGYGHKQIQLGQKVLQTLKIQKMKKLRLQKCLKKNMINYFMRLLKIMSWRISHLMSCKKKMNWKIKRKKKLKILKTNKKLNFKLKIL